MGKAHHETRRIDSSFGSGRHLVFGTEMQFVDPVKKKIGGLSSSLNNFSAQSSIVKQ
jgi:hypothetical protein